jgi:hypothetical protein
MRTMRLPSSEPKSPDRARHGQCSHIETPRRTLSESRSSGLDLLVGWGFCFFWVEQAGLRNALRHHRGSSASRSSQGRQGRAWCHPCQLRRAIVMPVSRVSSRSRASIWAGTPFAQLDLSHNDNRCSIVHASGDLGPRWTSVQHSCLALGHSRELLTGQAP